MPSGTKVGAFALNPLTERHDRSPNVAPGLAGRRPMSRDPLRPNTPSRQPTEGGRLRHQEMREMTTLAGSLLDFILGLFHDPEAAAAFDVNPEKALADAGLSDCTPDDVHALMPMVTDFAPTSGGHHGGNDKDKDEDDRGHHKPDEDSDKDDDKDDDGKDKDHHGGNGHDVAVIHNSYVENHYNSDVDIDASNSVWAGGDAYAIWGDDTTIATGGSVAGGRDRKSTRLNSSHMSISYAVFCLQKKKREREREVLVRAASRGPPPTASAVRERVSAHATHLVGTFSSGISSPAVP